MKRLDAAFAMLEVLERRRAEADKRRFVEQMERDLVDSYIRDLEPEPWTRVSMQWFSGRWSLQLISFLAALRSVVLATFCVTRIGTCRPRRALKKRQYACIRRPPQ